MVRSTPTLTPIGARVHYHHGEVLPALCMPSNVLQFSLSQSNFFFPLSGLVEHHDLQVNSQFR